MRVNVLHQVSHMIRTVPGRTCARTVAIEAFQETVTNNRHGI